MNLNVDIDNVLCDTLRLTLALAYRDRNLVIRPEEITDFYYRDDRFSLTELYSELTLKDEILILAPEVPLAVYTLRKLSAFRDMSISLVTARSPIFNEVTREWLYLHNVPYDKLFMLGNGKKSTVDGDLLIDDSAENIDDWVTVTGKPAILYPEFWNTSYRSGLVAKHPTKVIIPSGNNDAEVWGSIYEIIKRQIDSYDYHPAWLQLSF